VEPENDERTRIGRIYVAPRDRHVVMDDGRFCLNRGPRQHFTRPAIDPLFVSAALHYKRQVVGVILSGGGDDGVDGLIAIKAAGGISIAQDPKEAKDPDMPHSAILFDHVDLVLPIAAMAPALLKLAKGDTVDRTPRGGCHGKADRAGLI
jgi:two-component system chemotaxis response regulator CheB